MKILEHKSINKTFTSSKYTLLFREGRELWHYYNCKNGFLHKISIQNLLVFYQVPEEKSITLGIPVKARKIWDKMIFKITESNIWDLSILIPFSSIGTKRRLITLLQVSAIERSSCIYCIYSDLNLQTTNKNDLTSEDILRQ